MRGLERIALLFPHIRIFLSLFSFILVLVTSSPLSAQPFETVVISIQLNGEGKGDFFVEIDNGGEIYVKTKDLRTMGFRDPSGIVVTGLDVEYMLVSSMSGVTSAFDESTLSLSLTAPPRLLQSSDITISRPRHRDVYYPQDTSAFLNYRFDFSDYLYPDTQDYFFTGELGTRYRDFLFLSDSLYRKTPMDERFVRLMTSLTKDDRSSLQRLTVGDFISLSGPLGNRVNMGGIIISKQYGMDPYLITSPLMNFSGVAETRSDVDVYIGNTRIYSDTLPPGEFDLRDIYYRGGSRDLRVVVTDAFGRERVVETPFYFTDQLLRAGLHEYSYGMGFIREGFGLESNRYSHFAFSGYHRYGQSNDLTTGFVTEGKIGLYNVGPLAEFRLGTSGIISGSVMGSTGQQRGGLAGSIGYSYQDPHFIARVSARGFSRHYRMLNSTSFTDDLRYEVFGLAGYGTSRIGFFSLSYGESSMYAAPDRKEIRASFSKSITNTTSLVLMLRNSQQERTNNEVFLGLSYYPDPDHSVYAEVRSDRSSDFESLRVEKNVPVGEGAGYGTVVERENTGSETVYTVNPFVQYNSPHGTLKGEYWYENHDGDNRDYYFLSGAGGMIYVGNRISFTRPVTDSFALVKVENVEGVTVFRNNIEIGKTDASGTVILPDLSSFSDNLISLNESDIPLEYYMPGTSQYVSPPYRSGTCIIFPLTRPQAISGRLFIQNKDTSLPLEMKVATMDIPGETLTFETGLDGEFFLETGVPAQPGMLSDYREWGCDYLSREKMYKSRRIGPGDHTIHVKDRKKQYSCMLTVPDSTETIIDVGKTVCEE